MLNLIVRIGLSAIDFGIFAAFAGIRLASEQVHRLRKRAVGLRADRTKRHRAADEAARNLIYWFDVRHGERSRPRSELE